MKLTLIICFFGCFVCDPLAAFTQTDFRKANQHKIDSIKLLLTPVCKILSSSKTLAKREIDYDKRLMPVINDFYLKDLSISEIRKQTGKATKARYSFDSINLGGAILYHLTPFTRGNLKLDLSIATFEHRIVSKRISFNTVSKTGCLDPVNYLIAPNDINYIETICIPALKIPLDMCWNRLSILADTTLHNVMKSYHGDEYVLFSSDTAHLLNSLTWQDISTYMNDYVVEEIVPIVKNKNITLLEQLLYSPNHILAIYAMEALTFFELSEQQILDDQTHKKMNEIRNSGIPIQYQYSDVVKHGILYKNIKLSNQQLVNKFGRL
jgi:hypothetical protein